MDLVAQAQNALSVTFSTSLDLALILIAVALLTVVGAYFGRDRLAALVFSWYGAAVIYIFFPYQKFLDGLAGTPFGISLVHFGFFFLLIGLFYFVLSPSLFLSQSFSVPVRLFESLILAILFVALMLVALFHVVEATNLYSFSPLIKTLFASEQYVFWWLVLPLPVLWFTRG